MLLPDQTLQLSQNAIAVSHDIQLLLSGCLPLPRGKPVSIYPAGSTWGWHRRPGPARCTATQRREPRSICPWQRENPSPWEKMTARLVQSTCPLAGRDVQPLLGHWCRYVHISSSAHTDAATAQGLGCSQHAGLAAQMLLLPPSNSPRCQ